MGLYLVVATGHELLRRGHGGHAQCWSWNIAKRRAVVGQREVVVARFRGILFKRVEVVLLSIELILLEVAQRLAISTRLMCATMPINEVSDGKWLEDKT